MSGVRVGLLGCGGFSGAHARRMKVMPDVKIVALCDVRPENLEGLVQRRLADYQPAPARFADAAAMYRQAALDAVVIATPHALHFPQAMEALTAGCHVLVEKPMVVTVDQAQRLAAAAKASGRTVMVGYNTPCTPAIGYVRDAIRNGRFGRLELVCGYLAQDWKKATAGTWRHDPDLAGGGQSFDSGAHLLAGLCWAIGSPAVEVDARVDRQETRVDINACVLARFANGTMASLAIGGNSAANASHLAYIFEGGRIEVDGWGGGWLRAFDGKGAVQTPDVTIPEANPDAHFVDVIQGRAAPLYTPDDGVAHIRFMEALYASARDSRPVRLG